MVDIKEVDTRLKNYDDEVNMKDFNRHCLIKEEFKFGFEKQMELKITGWFT